MAMNAEKKTVDSRNKKIRMNVSALALVLTALLFVGCGASEPAVNETSTISQVESTTESEETTEEVTEEVSEESVETSTENIETESSTETTPVETPENNLPEETTPESTTETEPETVVTPEPTPEPTTETVQTPEEVEEEEEELTIPQRQAINMLNYITVLTQEINSSKNSRIYLDSAQSALLNNMDLNAIDNTTKGQINSLWRTIDGYKMIDVKRERLDYIYEQNKAQALRSAIPNPVGLLSAAQPGGLLKTAASVIYMAVDSKASYDSAMMSADLKHLQDNWELDDAETQELSNSQLNLLNYMIEMAHNNGIPTESTLNENSVKDFVDWVGKDNLVSKISWLESHEDVYKEFRTYWLELAESYYNSGIENDSKSDYRKCLSAMEQYEEVATKIFRKDYDYAKTLPMAIIAAKETKSEKDYIEYADKYVGEIIKNCDDGDWDLRYFAAQIYIDLYVCTEDKDYLEKAYGIAYDNVNLLKDEQLALNAAYCEPIKKEENKEGYTKRQKEEVKDYNKLLEEKRKVELPPVSEAFYLNCDLLFALADERNISLSEKKKIDAIIHDGGEPIFLTEALDNQYWANKKVDEINSEEIETIEFTGDKLVIPASCITDRSEIKVTISDGTVLDDWTVKEVKRPKNSEEVSEFMVTLTSKEAKDHKYTAGEKITVSVTPAADKPEETIDFKYEVKGKKSLGVIKGTEIVRVK